ncbi:SDR family oxidoreductase [Vulcanococcus limneticus]|uniref:SDR family oxidoreductase n=1 Tax=Vulcanococcus limneticus TaxID=2170428 RepID=UPI00398BE396
MRASSPHPADQRRQPGDRVLVLVSISGKRVKRHQSAYPISKHALKGLCQAMGNEGWGQGIGVTAIGPSWVATDMAAAVTALPGEARTQADDIAALTSQLLQLPDSDVPLELAVSCQRES